MDDEPTALEILGSIFHEALMHPFISKENSTNMNNSPEYNEPLGVRKYMIEFTYSGKTYTSLFRLKSIGSGDKCIVLYFYNECIFLDYNCSSKTYEITIHADDEKKGCFQPPLPGKQLDVLTILATKLCLVTPGMRRIEAVNVAKKNDIRISKAKLVRGLPTVYEKYGYVNPALNVALNKIKTITFDNLSAELKNIMVAVTGREIAGDELLTELMNSIPAEKENSNALKKYPFSEVVQIEKKRLSHILYKFLSEKYGLPKMFSLTFDLNSPKWNEIKDTLRITNVETVGVGGKRKTRKRRNRRRHHTKTPIKYTAMFDVESYHVPTSIIHTYSANPHTLTLDFTHKNPCNAFALTLDFYT